MIDVGVVERFGGAGGTCGGTCGGIGDEPDESRDDGEKVSRGNDASRDCGENVSREDGVGNGLSRDDAGGSRDGGVVEMITEAAVEGEFMKLEWLLCFVTSLLRPLLSICT